MYVEGFISYGLVPKSKVEESAGGRVGRRKVCVTNPKFVLPPAFAAVRYLRERDYNGLSQNFYQSKEPAYDAKCDKGLLFPNVQ